MSDEYYLETALAGACLVGMVILFAQMRGIYLILFASLFTVFTFAMCRYIKSLLTRIRRAEEQISDSMRSVEIATWRYDTEDGELILNAGAKKLTGLTSKELRDDPEALLKIIHRDDIEDIIEEREHLLSGEIFESTMSYRIVKDGKTEVWLRDLVTAVHNDDGDIIALEGMLTDITETRRLEEKIEYLSTHDVLTGLLNRDGIYRKLSEDIKHHEAIGACLAAAVIDLDHFQMLNHESGPSTGDLYLRSLAGRLEEAVDPKNTIGRFGGDEFIAIITETTPMDVENICKTILNIIGEAVTLEGRRITASASIGVSMYPVDSFDIDHLINFADEAMTIAKGRGRACIEFISDHRNEHVDK